MSEGLPRLSRFSKGQIQETPKPEVEMGSGLSSKEVIGSGDLIRLPGMLAYIKMIRLLFL